MVGKFEETLRRRDSKLNRPANSPCATLPHMTELALTLLVILLCLGGTALSALAFSGTWLVWIAALLAHLFGDAPALTTVMVFTALCIAAEIFEAVAGWLGIRKQGGSKLAGLASVAGGILGGVVGSALLPLIGTVLGMLGGSFALAFLVEWNRLKQHGQAAQIALGALVARVVILLLKTLMTLLMSGWLLFEMLRP